MANAAPATATMGTSTGPRRRVGWSTLLRVLWRSFFFQAAVNFERMQNVGFAFCIMPALTRLYQGEELKRAMARHLEFFNSHPYMADALLGATVRLEEEIAAGAAPPERVQVFKTSMMGPLAAIGDSFFWASLKPFAASLGVACVLVDLTWAPLVFLLLYNMFHLTLRVFGLWAGYRMGDRVFEKLYRFDLVGFSDRSHYLAGLFLGIVGGLLALRATETPVALAPGMSAMLFLALVLIFFQCIKRRMPLLFLLYGGCGLCLLVILALNAAYPLL